MRIEIRHLISYLNKHIKWLYERWSRNSGPQIDPRGLMMHSPVKALTRRMFSLP
jgi:hypothetical protein